MADASHGRDVDELSGTETTGHEWDGIKELNTPLPSWWVWVFYATVAWSVVYWILMPSWPLISDYTKGIRGHSQRALVAEQVAELQAFRAERGAGLIDAALEEIRDTPELLTFAMANGQAAFGDNCAACHGTGAAGFVGYPNLNDDAWLWGGTLEDIHQTILFGIRSAHDETRFGDMPGFGRDGVLDREQIRDVTAYVLSLSGLEGPTGASLEEGAVIYDDNCAACHGDNGEGVHALGAPNLADAIWLFGSSIEQVTESIANGRAGVMPAFVDRLDPITAKSLAVYVHSLGGGQ